MTKVGPGTSPVASGQVSGEVGGEVSGEVDGEAGEKPVTVNLDIQRLNALLQYCEEARSHRNAGVLRHQITGLFQAQHSSTPAGKRQAEAHNPR